MQGSQGHKGTKLTSTLRPPGTARILLQAGLFLPHGMVLGKLLHREKPPRGKQGSLPTGDGAKRLLGLQKGSWVPKKAWGREGREASTKAAGGTEIYPWRKRKATEGTGKGLDSRGCGEQTWKFNPRRGPQLLPSSVKTLLSKKKKLIAKEPNKRNPTG